MPVIPKFTPRVVQGVPSISPAAAGAPSRALAQAGAQFAGAAREGAVVSAFLQKQDAESRARDLKAQRTLKASQINMDMTIAENNFALSIADSTDHEGMREKTQKFLQSLRNKFQGTIGGDPELQALFNGRYGRAVASLTNLSEAKANTIMSEKADATDSVNSGFAMEEYIDELDPAERIRIAAARREALFGMAAAGFLKGGEKEAQERFEEWQAEAENGFALRSVDTTLKSFRNEDGTQDYDAGIEYLAQNSTTLGLDEKQISAMTGDLKDQKSLAKQQAEEDEDDKNQAISDKVYGMVNKGDKQGALDFLNSIPEGEISELERNKTGAAIVKPAPIITDWPLFRKLSAQIRNKKIIKQSDLLQYRPRLAPGEYNTLESNIALTNKEGQDTKEGRQVKEARASMKRFLVGGGYQAVDTDDRTAEDFIKEEIRYNEDLNELDGWLMDNPGEPAVNFIKEKLIQPSQEITVRDILKKIEGSALFKTLTFGGGFIPPEETPGGIAVPPTRDEWIKAAKKVNSHHTVQELGEFYDAQRGGP